MSGDRMDADKLTLQEMVFKRWTNHILVTKNMKIENFYSDLGNGIHIVHLIEALTCHEFKAIIKNPSFRTQKMENITMVLKYLRENECMKFLNIDSSNILNKESKLVLSFMWHIIEYFSIIKPLDLFFQTQNIKSPGKTTKQKFMNWIKSKVPATVRNLSSDVKTGTVIGALVNSCNPQLCSDWRTWQERDSIQNARIAIALADEKLGVSSLITAEEIVNGKLDEKSMMTYLSQFISCGARSNCKISLQDSDMDVNDRCYFENILNFKGRGIQSSGIRVGDIVNFTVEILKDEAFTVDNVLVKINSPDGRPTSFQNMYGPKCMHCSYSPLAVGIYEIMVQLSNYRKEFHVSVNPKVHNDIKAFGSGLVYAACGEAAVFMVETNGETGTLNFTIEGPNEAQIECKDNGDGSATVAYWPRTVGEYAVHILYEEEDIKNSPFIIDVKCKNNNINPLKVNAYGPALCEGRLTVGQPANFTVDVSKSNEKLDPLSVECFDRFGETVHVDIISTGVHKRTFSLVPQSSMKLTLWILYGGICVTGSPFTVYVAEDKLSNKIRVQGSGLQSAISGKESIFFIDCRLLPKEGELSVVIKDPNSIHIPCLFDRNSNDRKIYSVRYVPPYNIQKCFVEILYDKIPVYDEQIEVPISKDGQRSLSQTSGNSEESGRGIVEVKPMLNLGKSEAPDKSLSILSARDYSDLFLDPKAESYLKLIVPPDNYCEALTVGDLPLPPLELATDSGDNSLRNASSKMLLSTVIEESEENVSAKDSNFSSDCYSRTSIKDDYLSLSRRSSLTLTHSPGVTSTISYFKQDMNYETHNSPTYGSFLPSKQNNERLEDFIIASSRNETFDPMPEFPDLDEFDELLPLPEPPMDAELLCNKTFRSVVMSPATLCHVNFGLDVVQKVEAIPQIAVSVTDQWDSGRSFINILNSIYKLCVPDLIMGIRCYCRLTQTSTKILVDDCVVFRRSRKGVYMVDEKVESEKSFSEMMPVTHLEAIISPFDSASNYISDSSDHSTASGSNQVLNTACSNNASQRTDNEFEPMLPMERIISNKVSMLEHQRPSFKFLKDVTTSEVSEISETSQWVSNEDRMIANTENSASEVPKFGIGSSECKEIYTKEYGGDCNNCKYDANIRKRAQSRKVRPSINGDIHSDEVKDDSDTFGSKGNNKTKIPYKHVSWENDVGSISCQSSVFPDPPSLIADTGFNITMNKSNLFFDENQKTRNCSLKTLKDNTMRFEDFRINDSSCLKNQKSKNQMEPSTLYSKSLLMDKDLHNVGTSESVSIYESMDASQELHSNTNVNYLPGETYGNGDGTHSLGKIRLKESDYIDPTNIFSQNTKRNNSASPNLSFDHYRTDFQNLNVLYRRKLHGKRRSFSQSCSGSAPFIFSTPDPRSETCYSNKQHIRAFSESDNERLMNVFLGDEEEPIKLSKNDGISLIGSVGTMNTSLYSWSSTLQRDKNVEKKLLPKQRIMYVDGGVKSYVSPKKVLEKGIWSSKINEKEIVTVDGEGLCRASVGRTAEFTIHTGCIGTDGISLVIEGPSKTEIETINLPNGDCKVTYNPKVSGEYQLTIHHNGVKTSCSPYHIEVRDEQKKGALSSMSPSNKVYAEGQGLTSAYKNYSNQFTIYTKDSGPGGLSLSIEGPSKAYIEFQDVKNGACVVTYRVTEVGLYTCIVKFNKNHIRDSPFSINVGSMLQRSINSKENKSSIEKANQNFQIGRKSIFKTDLNSISMEGISKLMAIMCSPSGTLKELSVSKDSGNEIVWVEFTPQVEGQHKLYFLDESKRMDSVPKENCFNLVVESLSEFDQESFERELRSIKVYGKGLIRGKSGYSNIFFIEIGESVSGALNVTVDGPSKVEIKCNETDKGFRFSYIPGIPGEYLVTIKYGGERQIKGSPFQVKIIASSKSCKYANARRKTYMSPQPKSCLPEVPPCLINENINITSYGSGLQKGKALVWMDFYIDASKTKILNHLFVGMVGPSQPCEEIKISYMDNKRFLVSYLTRERGPHSLVMKWGEQHLPGSPALVDID